VHGTIESTLEIEWRPLAGLASIAPEWRGLAARALVPNVFYEPAFAAIAVWFRRDRGRALVVLTFFGGLASLVFIPLTAWLVRHYEWRTALLVLAGILATFTVGPHALLLRRRPADLGLLPDGATVPLRAAEPLPAEASSTASAALRGITFWWLTLAFGLTTLASVSFTVHLIPYLVGQGVASASRTLFTPCPEPVHPRRLRAWQR